MSGFWLVMLASFATLLGAVANVIHYLAAKNKAAAKDALAAKEEKIAGYLDEVKKLVDAQTAPKA